MTRTTRMTGMTCEPVVVPKAFAFTMTASRSGTNYRVAVAEPIGPVPPGGYPIVYMLDAGGSFATMVEAIRARCRRPDATGVGPAFVVGIGSHGGEGAVDRAESRLRTHDYTPGPSVTPDDHSIPGGARSSGGAETFREFLEQELIPGIEEQGVEHQGIEQDIERGLRINPRRRVLFGHSLAGFFALWTLTQGSRAFDTVIAASPSIWWNPPLLLDPLAVPGQALWREDAWRPRVMLTVGEHEQRRAPWQPMGAWTEDAIRRRTERRMVDAAREMADALGSAGAIVDFHEFAGEDHASVVILSIARALRFALPAAKADQETS
jgi:predicted alpha/beta superfamily hydrolase